MLLNEFLKEHRKVEEQDRKIQEQQTTITQLKREMANVVARLDEQDSKIQKVNAKLAAASPSRGGLEVSKPAPQMVENNQQRSAVQKRLGTARRAVRTVRAGLALQRDVPAI